MDQINTSHKIDMKKMINELEQVRVMICSNNCIIIGQLYYSPKQRFLDMLNKGFDLEQYHFNQFIIVDQPLLINSDGERERTPGTCFINKDSVVFIGTFEKTRSTTSETINSVKLYPWRKKDVLQVNMVLVGQHKLVGQMHNDPRILPLYSIESHDNFLPMTDVKVYSSLEPHEISFDFVAVNKNKAFMIQIS